MNMFDISMKLKKDIVEIHGKEKMFKEAEKIIWDIQKEKVIYNYEILDLMAKYNEFFEGIVIPIYKEMGLTIPFPQIYVVDKEKLGGVSFKYENSYYIIIYSGILTIQKAHLKEVFSRRNKDINDSYIEKIMEYTIQFVVMHEYMYLFCGHCLQSKSEKIIQEAEADIEAANVMIKKILQEYEGENIQKELIDCFVAIFYFMKSLEVQNTDEMYNIKKVDNYYDEKERDHPLTAQRIMYLYKCFNVFFYKTGANKLYSIREGIINKLLELGEKETKGAHMALLYDNTIDSIEKMEKEIENIRKKIPRVGVASDNLQ